jgi:thiol-disulfide isomerase/thioredoxin
MKKRITPFTVLLAVWIAFVGVYVWVARDVPAPGESVGAERVQGAAPELVYHEQGGAEARLSGLRGRPVLVHFWATWCLACRDELPGLLAFADSGEIAILAVSMDSGWEPVRRFFGGDVPRAVVLAAPGTEPERFGVTGLPESYLVDASGQLRLRFSGPRDWRSDALRETVTRASASE